MAKTCGLLDAKGIGAGDEVGIWLPVHWQSAVLIASCWRLGASPALASAPVPVAFVYGPHLDEVLDSPDPPDEVLGLALAPMAGRLRDVPLGVEDYAVEVPGYGDSWYGSYPRDEQAVTDHALEGKRVLMTAIEWDEATITKSLVTPIATGGSLVIVRNCDPAKLDRTTSDERVEETI